MKLPIIISEHGDLSLYDSLEAAQCDVEAIDVRNNEYIAFDSEGRLLKLDLVPMRWTDGVSISVAEVEPTHQSALAATIHVFLKRVLPIESSLDSMSLNELVGRLQSWGSEGEERAKGVRVRRHKPEESRE